MDYRLTEGSQSDQAVPKTYADIFDEFLPQYLAIGMPYDLYWDGEYGTKTAYRKAYQARMQNEQRIADINNWNMGHYLIKVLQAVPLLVGGLNTKGHNLPDYPDRPLLETAELEKREKERKDREEARRKKEEDQSKLAQAVFQQWVAQMNCNIEKRLDRERKEREQEGTGQ